jgi:muconate cycloisomerase
VYYTGKRVANLSRRTLLRAAALGCAAPRFLAGGSSSKRRTLTITDIETHEILLPYDAYHASNLFRYHGLGVQLRTVYVLKTDTGLEGLGESWGPAPPKTAYAKYIGTDPFDWIGSTADLPMNMAMYDLMGKHLGIPAWKLIGPRVRSWIPVSAWIISQPPAAMAEEVRRLSGLGYSWMKYHVDVLHNVIDQTVEMQKAAPRGFKVHYDFNADSSVASILPVLKELEKFPIAGRFEDALRGEDQDGYRILRQKCALPLIVHHAPADVFMLEHLCDGFMAGHAPVGEAMRLAAIAEGTRTPFMLQQCGGTINQAFLAHEAAVFQMATIPHVDLAHLWADDITAKRMRVTGGSVAVPAGPGLGVALDQEKLARYERAPRPKQTRFLVRASYSGGPTIYFRFDPDAPGANLRALSGNLPGPVSGYANPVQTDFWDDTASPDFQSWWDRTGHGPAWTGPERQP